MNALRLLLSILISASAVSLAAAHPLPSFQFDRVGTVKLTADRIEIDYSLDISLFAMAIDAKGLFTREEEHRIGGRQKEFAWAYGEKKAPLIADQFRVNGNGRDVALTPQLKSVTFEDTHARFHFTFTARRDGNESTGRFQFEDQSFEDRPGTIDWSFASREFLETIVEPTDLRGKSPLNMTAAEVERRRKLSAVMKFPGVEKTQPSPSPRVLENDPDRFRMDTVEDEGLFQTLKNRGLVAFFDSNAGTGVLLFAAMLFGMAHAVTPGHGKTLVAAYLVGERGTVGHAVVLGLTTTLAHTGSVIAVAAVLWYAYRDGVPETARAWLQFVGGLLILLVGVWLLLQRLRGRADHVHLPSGQSQAKKSFGWLRVILLGLAGGMIPCWDAVLLLMVAISAGRLAFALPLLVSFSIGLSAVLIVLGVGVVFAARAGGRSFGESRWFRMLPTVSALVLVVVGVWFVRDAFHMFEEADRNLPVPAKE